MLEELEEVLPNLEESLKKISKQYKKEESMTPSMYKLKNIVEIDSNSRLLSEQGIRLQLYANGSSIMAEPMKLFLSTSYLKKGIKGKLQALDRFFEILSCNDGVMSLFGVKGKKAQPRRAFKLDGEEITDISMMESNDKIWLSLGEDFIPIQCK